MKIEGFIQDIKTEIEKKEGLAEERKIIYQRIKKGEEKFQEISKNPTNASPEMHLRGAEIFLGCIESLKAIEQKLFDIDTIIVTKLESYLSDFVAKITIPAKTNDAGDIINKTQIAFVSHLSESPSMVEITPDDLWFLKIIKAALDRSNVEIISKQEYLKGDNNEKLI